MNVSMIPAMTLLLGTQLLFALPKDERQIPLDSIFVLLNQNSTQLKLSQTKVETALSERSCTYY